LAFPVNGARKPERLKRRLVKGVVVEAAVEEKAVEAAEWGAAVTVRILVAYGEIRTPWIPVRIL
jgi:hypothetical protein